MLRTALPYVLLGGLVVATLSCDPTSQSAFTSGLAFNPCVQALNACAGGLTATCELNSTMYAQTDFPGSFRFLVSADPGDLVEIHMFLMNQSDSGVDTRFLWYEPGCTNVQSQDTAGSQLFLEANGTNSVVRSATVAESGNHLIEVESDMQAQALISPRVHMPGQ